MTMSHSDHRVRCVLLLLACLNTGPVIAVRDDSCTAAPPGAAGIAEPQELALMQVYLEQGKDTRPAELLHPKAGNVQQSHEIRRAEQPPSLQLTQTGSRNNASSDSSSLSGADTTTTTAALASAADLTQQNGEGDLEAFFSNICTNVFIIAFCLLSFEVLRSIFPIVYAHYAMPGMSPGPPPQERGWCLGWALQAWNYPIDDMIKEVGLDQAMLIEFTRLAMRIILVVGAPCLLLVPFHIGLGGGYAGPDTLSWHGFANVTFGNPLCYVHAFLVWYVVGVTQFMIHRAMRDFIPRRFKYLKEMPEPMDTTVLMVGMPEGFENSKEGITQHWDEAVFGYPVTKEVNIVKDTTELLTLQQQVSEATQAIEKAENPAPGAEPQPAGSLEELITKKREAETMVAKVREDINSSNDCNTNNAFVTFKTRRQCTAAFKMFSAQNEAEIECSIPPEPTDIMWKDLVVDEKAQKVRAMLGLACTVGLYFVFTPLVIGISTLSSLTTLGSWFPFIHSFVEANPGIEEIWNGLVQSTVLSLVLGFVPTFYEIIFSRFFVLNSHVALQEKIQKAYFVFLIVFVLCITAISSSLFDLVGQLAKEPTQIVSILAESLPRSTHFYLNFLPVQTAAHGINLLRVAPLCKYQLFKLIYSEKEAKAKAEPEDPAFYGIGGRSARWALLLVLTLVFCQMSPVISILGMANFAFTRFIYTYKIIYAETRKSTLGGTFWYNQLRHVQWGLFFFIFLETGVLVNRYHNYAPGVIAASSLAMMIVLYNRFVTEFRWEFLEFRECGEDEKIQKRKTAITTFKQLELLKPGELEQAADGAPNRQGAISMLSPALPAK